MDNLKCKDLQFFGQKQMAEVKKDDRIVQIIITRRMHGMLDDSRLKSLARGGVDCTIEVDGQVVYEIRQSFVHYKQTEPWRFEQWLIFGIGSSEQGKDQQNERSYRCGFVKRIRTVMKLILGNK
uniref:hypothetical protein n=1 Tax=Alistipes megaguti TaxID=2364787 RepID=UPI0013CF34A6|nr:hypothetical protein [Alistipes megaguti]